MSWAGGPGPLHRRRDGPSFSQLLRHLARGWVGRGPEREGSNVTTVHPGPSSAPLPTKWESTKWGSTRHLALYHAGPKETVGPLGGMQPKILSLSLGWF